MRDAGGTPIVSTDLHAFDYIGRISAVPFCGDPNGDRDLAVLVTLRATSHRSLLIVYGADGAIVYEEHLERTGPGRQAADAMFVTSDGGAEVLVVDHGVVSAYGCAVG